MSDLSDDDMNTSPTERDDDRDPGGEGPNDTGDATESSDDLDQGSHGERDAGDE
jgi:hypothetical protein